MSARDKVIQQGVSLQFRRADGAMARFGRIENLDRDFDLDYWQSRSSRERFEAAWQLVVDYHLRKGRPLDELRLQRTVGGIQQDPG